MRGFFWVLCLLGGLFGGLQLWATLTELDSAPQQAAGAALACGLAVIPYVVARAISELWGDGEGE